MEKFEYLNKLSMSLSNHDCCCALLQSFRGLRQHGCSGPDAESFCPFASSPWSQAASLDTPLR